MRPVPATEFRRLASALFLCQRHRLTDIDSRAPEQPRNRILLQPRRVELHANGPPFVVEPNRSATVDFAHRVDRSQLVFPGKSPVVENHLNIGQSSKILLYDEFGIPVRIGGMNPI